MQFNEHEAITDKRLLKQSMTVLALVIIGFILAHPLHLEPATIAMAGAALLLLLDNLHTTLNASPSRCTRPSARSNG